MKKIIAVFVLIVLSVRLVLAHGEDKLGPHKGFIRMPGAFHTEAVTDGKNKLKVYLLDMGWKNPSILKSSVEARLMSQDSKVICQPKDNYFHCVFPSKVNLTKKDELKILAKREDQVGSEAIYNLPLKLEKLKKSEKIEKMDHEGMHH